MICTFPLTLHNTQLLAIITLKRTILQQWTNMLMFFSLTGFQTLLTGASGVPWGALRAACTASGAPWGALRAACTGRASLAYTSPSPTPARSCLLRKVVSGWWFSWVVCLSEKVNREQPEVHTNRPGFPQLPRATSPGNTTHIFFVLCAKPQKKSFPTTPSQGSLHLPWVRLHYTWSLQTPTS